MNPLIEIVETIARERAEFIDDTITNRVPKWKIKIIEMFPYKWVKRLLNVILEIEQSSGPEIKTTIRLNGKVIGVNTIKLEFTNKGIVDPILQKETKVYRA